MGRADGSEAGDELVQGGYRNLLDVPVIVYRGRPRPPR
jgi:hypothetical protein